MQKLHEECGIFAISGTSGRDPATDTYYGLFALQHRGQEGCGIAVNKNGQICIHKDLGLVNEVFDTTRLSMLAGAQMALGHVRYGTTGSSLRANVQPLVINHLEGSMALAHNGNLTNDMQLRRQLEEAGCIFHTSSDTEVIAYILTGNRMKEPTIEAALSKTMDQIKGAYSLAVMTQGKLLAARDPNGFRPLCLGSVDGHYLVSSESCAIDAIGGTFIRDIEPGEIISIQNDKLKSDRSHCGKPRSLCVFELIYFARPDSKLDGISVHKARIRAGGFLALEHPIQADVVIGVPDSGIDAAIGYARQSGIPYEIGLIKNKYIGRTFIQPGQGNRERAVSIKLNPITSVVNGKRVILIDDSIVRGTTSKRLVSLLRSKGAKEVHFLSAAPKFLYPCYFGTDIDSSENLFAYKYNDEEMKQILDVDSIGFLSTDNVSKLADIPSKGFCTACFTGKYPLQVDKTGRKDKYDRGTANE
ncbi:MAG: amidophosphoribosyltransferase [Spirochaetia bacterium]|jgi:amidophosphoribosyltransferase|nr:amidophosphoribosyltransferase [Spirochaetia bacterium]